MNSRVLAVCRRFVSSVALLFLSLMCSAAESPLAHYGVDPQRITVSGLSSGGYMAVQLAVAYSSTFSGVAVIAGGPYACAYTGEGLPANTNRALGPCMSGGYGWIQKWQCTFMIGTCAGTDGPDPQRSIQLAQTFERRGTIDALANLKRQRVFLLSGDKDVKVVPAVVDALQRFYIEFTVPSNILRERLKDVAHTFPTDDFAKGNACSRTTAPYVSDCHYDTAGKLLAHLYGNLAPRNNGAQQGSFIAFDQRQFAPGDTGLAARGFVYVPKACAARDGHCALHVALHGCDQTIADIGMTFVERTGYNRWADTNKLIVLYPEVDKGNTFSTNPESCWDWWGYTGENWLERSAPQMRAIAAMIDWLKARAP